MAMKMRMLASLLVLASPASADDRFNCPQPKGELRFDEAAITNAWPTHIDRILPEVVEVDFRCRVDANGGFVDCAFVTRQDLTERQERIVQKAMPRIMRATTTDVPNQRCVANKIVFRQGDTAKQSIPPPDEAAAEGVVPDRTDQDPA
ncbi:hypothetical protein [Erythrobacter sp. JK5]|uniref:hypothetical protein n=1 Tax=Erythrobacter sp. JK5 TaxID=2829500 RepID=UPI001BA6FCDE|nr:hypothetical protein [Erythrobacter sp. JK5]QUL38350.1 hypothetical protein KDC96_02740 [Erythrobacter sp. JK5]